MTAALRVVPELLVGWLLLGVVAGFWADRYGQRHRRGRGRHRPR